MGPRPWLSLEKRYEVVAYSNIGPWGNQIASTFGVSWSGVLVMLKKERLTGSIADGKGMWQKRKTTAQEDWQLIQASLTNCKATANELREEMIKDMSKRLSATLVKYRLFEHGLRSCRALKKPALSPKNRTKRLAWAPAHSAWTVEDWERELLTDKYRFCLFSNAPVCMRRARARVITWNASRARLNTEEAG